MSNKGDENQKPLMYIVQPSYDESAPAMQNIVRKRKKSEKPPESKKSTKEEASEESRQEPISQEVEQKKEEPPAPERQQKREVIQESELSQERESVQEQEKPPEGVFHESKEEPKRKRVKKPLSQMNVEEKVDFLTSLPHNMPRALCLIEADGKTYRGIIIERKDNTVVIRTAGGGNPVELAMDDISSIHPLGF